MKVIDDPRAPHPYIPLGSASSMNWTGTRLGLSLNALQELSPGRPIPRELAQIGLRNNAASISIFSLHLHPIFGSAVVHVNVT